jgi:hypothetical protein
MFPLKGSLKLRHISIEKSAQMRIRKNIALVLIVVTTAAGASVLATFAGKNQNQIKGGPESADKALKGREAKQIDDEMTPVVEYEDEGSAKTQPNRQLRNSKHDKARWVAKDLDARVSEVVDESEWALGLSDLPVDKSDLIMEGQVIGAEAFLSNDRTGVYSEFSVQVTEVLKNSTGQSINLNDTVVMERIGGKVKYNSGKVIRYRIEGQGSPIRGQRYLFFLRRIDQARYHLLTAYHIKGETVFALDGSRINVRGQGDWVFDKHNGEGLEEFTRRVQAALKTNN